MEPERSGQFHRLVPIAVTPHLLQAQDIGVGLGQGARRSPPTGAPRGRTDPTGSSCRPGSLSGARSPAPRWRLGQRGGHDIAHLPSSDVKWGAVAAGAGQQEGALKSGDEGRGQSSAAAAPIPAALNRQAQASIHPAKTRSAASRTSSSVLAISPATVPIGNRSMKPLSSRTSAAVARRPGRPRPDPHTHRP